MSSFQIIQVIFGVVFFSGLLGFILWSVFGKAARVRSILRHPVVPIAEFPDGGAASVRGVVRSNGTLVPAPVSGRPSVLYRIELRYRSLQGVETVISSEEGGADFIVEDGSGEAVVPVPDRRSTHTTTTVTGIEWHAGEGAQYAWRDLGMERWETLIGRWGYTNDQLTGGRDPADEDRVSHFVQEWLVVPGVTATARGHGTRRSGASTPTVAFDGSPERPVAVVAVAD